MFKTTQHPAAAFFLKLRQGLDKMGTPNGRTYAQAKPVASAEIFFQEKGLNVCGEERVEAVLLVTKHRTTSLGPNSREQS